MRVQRYSFFFFFLNSICIFCVYTHFLRIEITFIWHFTALSRMSRETDGYDFVQFIFFRTSARPFPAGGFPPKVLQGNAGHLGKVSPRRKIIARAITFLRRSTCPYASISRHYCTKNALSCNFSSGRFANVHFFSYLCIRFSHGRQAAGNM